MKENDETIVLSFLDYTAYIDKELEVVTISSNDIYTVNLVLSKAEILNITKCLNSNCLKFKIGNKEINLSSDGYMFIDEIDKGIKIPVTEIMEIAQYFMERENIMTESNSTQNIYNKIMSLGSSKPADKIVKPIAAAGQQLKTKQSLFDTIIKTIDKESKGATDNESK